MNRPANLPRNSLHLFWWLRRLLFLIVKTNVVPENPRGELSLTPGVPVCYVLKHRSLSDLLVLDETCKKTGLPRPEFDTKALSHPGTAASLYLDRTGLINVARDPSKAPPSPLMRLVQQAKADPTMDVQLVPVSSFWGRNPGREERSILRLLFFDADHAGALQKFFIILAQGRINFLQFGKPVSLRSVINEGASAPDTAKKLRRVLRVHFARQRTATMGPSLPSRAGVIAHLIQTRALREAINEEAKRRKIPVDRAEARARRYLAEIASEQSWSMIRLSAMVLTWVWNRLFRGVVVEHAQRLRAIDPSHEIVYLPSHRSHMDYLLLVYCLYHEGMVAPHTAAGNNLDFWPVGPLLRRGGAFYLRRSFSGNHLYTVAFTEYLHYLLTKGHPVKFYVEGGRSRTGRLLHPKTGMLAMAVHSFLRDARRPIVFVPVFVGYDRVAEVRTYQTELRGNKKAKESLAQVLRARRIFKTDFGKAYIGIGEPLYLKDYLDRHAAGWDEAPNNELAERPKWLGSVVAKLGIDVLTRVNSAAVVSPTALFALVLLSTPTKAIAEDELVYLIDKVTALLRAWPYSPDVSLPASNARDSLRQVMVVSRVDRFQHPSGDVIHMDGRDASLLAYYRNNILHILALPAMVAAFFQHNDRVAETDLLASCVRLFPFLRHDFFLRFTDDEAEARLREVVAAMVSEGLLQRIGTDLCRPSVASRDLTLLLVLARALGQTLERYGVAAALLTRIGSEGVARDSFEANCSAMLQRIAILTASTEGELGDKGVLRGVIDRLAAQGYLCEDKPGTLVATSAAAELAQATAGLVSTDVRQSIARLGFGVRVSEGA